MKYNQHNISIISSIKGKIMTEYMTRFVFQAGIILIAATGSGLLFKKLRLPSVLGEIIAGVIIGPYVLGKIPLPGFPEGLFPFNSAMGFPVSAELYSFATVASMMLLFFSGLETDIKLFLHYSLSASFIGLSGAFFSFLLGDLASVLFLHEPFLSPKSMLLGCISMATSVGVTVRILSERKKIDTPEGVSVISAAVIDDVLGILTLSIVVAVSTSRAQSSSSSSETLFSILSFSIKIIALWLIFTVLSLLAARKIGRALKVFKNKMTFSLLSLSLAFFMGGIFEKSGLALIVGAYVMGLSLSRTDISYVVKESLNPLEAFFLPFFFTIMGMLVDPSIFFVKEIVIFGLLFSLFAFVSKIFGCALPAYITNFNLRGALRIGLGMVPRAEVALIIASFALMSNLFDEKTFGVSMMMAMLSIIVSPPFIDASFKSSKKGIKRDPKGFDEVDTTFDISNPELFSLILSNILVNFSKEGFFITHIQSQDNIHYIRKEKVFLKMSAVEDKIIFKSKKEDVGLINTIAYESFLELFETAQHLKTIAKPEELKKEIITNGFSKNDVNLMKFIDPKCVVVPLKSVKKEEVIKELLEVLFQNGKITEKKFLFEKILEREDMMSTGLENGLAVPHIRTNRVKNVEIAVGISRCGVKFDSIDNKDSKLFFLILSPEAESPHLQILASIGKIFGDSEFLLKISEIKNRDEFFEIMKSIKQPSKTVRSYFGKNNI
ncbi:cation:proton antiporter [candidate division WOR-3 bacterium]|nr:cation:proton antiporter [candidate division WOR-3 bacterium]